MIAFEHQHKKAVEYWNDGNEAKLREEYGRDADPRPSLLSQSHLAPSRTHSLRDRNSTLGDDLESPRALHSPKSPRDDPMRPPKSPRDAPRSPRDSAFGLPPSSPRDRRADTESPGQMLDEDEGKSKNDDDDDDDKDDNDDDDDDDDEVVDGPSRAPPGVPPLVPGSGSKLVAVRMSASVPNMPSLLARSASDLGPSRMAPSPSVDDVVSSAKAQLQHGTSSATSAAMARRASIAHSLTPPRVVSSRSLLVPASSAPSISPLSSTASAVVHEVKVAGRLETWLEPPLVGPISGKRAVFLRIVLEYADEDGDKQRTVIERAVLFQVNDGSGRVGVEINPNLLGDVNDVEADARSSLLNSVSPLMDSGAAGRRVAYMLLALFPRISTSSSNPSSARTSRSSSVVDEADNSPSSSRNEERRRSSLTSEKSPTAVRRSSSSTTNLLEVRRTSTGANSSGGNILDARRKSSGAGRAAVIAERRRSSTLTLVSGSTKAKKRPKINRFSLTKRTVEKIDFSQESKKKSALMPFITRAGFLPPTGLTTVTEEILEVGSRATVFGRCTEDSEGLFVFRDWANSLLCLSDNKYAWETSQWKRRWTSEDSDQARRAAAARAVAGNSIVSSSSYAPAGFRAPRSTSQRNLVSSPRVSVNHDERPERSDAVKELQARRGSLSRIPSLTTT